METPLPKPGLGDRAARLVACVVTPGSLKECAADAIPTIGPAGCCRSRPTAATRRRDGVSIFCHDCRPKCADQGNGGSRHGQRQCLAEQGGTIPRESTCDQRPATCSASPCAGPQLSQVC